MRRCQGEAPSRRWSLGSVEEPGGGREGEEEERDEGSKEGGGEGEAGGKLRKD